MLNVGIIGNGGISKSHRKAYTLLQSEAYPVNIAAVCDIRPEMFVTAGADELRYTEIDEFLEKEKGKLDYVDICLPTFLHAPVAIKAMEAGFNVLCEKPMALNHALALDMCAAAKKYGKLLMIAQSYRFNRSYKEMCRYVDEGIFGKVKTALFKRDGGTPKWGWENWFLNKERSGGAILDLHMHDVDGLRHIFGTPVSLSTGARNIIPGSGYDIVCSNFYYDGGLYVTATGDWSTANLNYSGRDKKIFFERGYIMQHICEKNNVFVAVAEDGTVTDLSEFLKGPESYYYEIKYFCDCLREGKPVDYCLPEASAESVRIVMAECESADKGGERIFL